MASSALSGVKATRQRGCGTPARVSALVVCSLLPHVSDTCAVLTVLTPRSFRMCRLYSARRG